MDTITTSTIGERVRKLRDEKGWTQEQLSEASRIPQPDISSIERGALNIGLKRAKMLARAFRRPLSHFLEDDLSYEKI